jgi:alkylation response protein AidB-like acyl-CoA dehydrogenase
VRLDGASQCVTNPAMPTQIDWAERAQHIAEEIGQYAAVHDDNDSFVREGYDALEREGFFKALVPEEFGGSGASAAQICGAIRVLGSACGSTALAFSMHSHLVATAAWRWRKLQAPTEALLRKVGEGGAILLSSGGSDWLQSAGTAEKVDGGFRIAARKGFSSGAPAADTLVTSAVYQDPADGPTVLHFAVPLNAEGVELQDSWRVIGMRGTGSHDIVLTNVFVPDAAISGRRPQGKWHPLFHAISMIAFPIIYSAYVGVAEGARERALSLISARPKDHHLIALTGEMDNALAGARVTHDRMVEIGEAGSPGPGTTNEVMILRTLVARSAIETVEKAMMVAGGASFYRSKGLERAFRDVQAARFHPLQERVQLDYAGRMALGLDIDG